ncbi:DUF1905 domain-containing protein [Raineyella sp. LH-20]|uniref:DUF1905 domain-containing protein n=1 Tax=Raineyella sp. LH-20 TaxID=3081204 RepID=UPI002952DFA2|nr:DUF1905 domain-containing protein [Raineyella sp. LH-20]WOP19711.1 DUF1905 domain-containing protein [Raineyella sp. LH-20]
MTDFTFTAPLWRWPGESPWHFVALPEELTDDVRMLAGPRKAFGSVRVEVTVGATTWRTSLFPDGGRDTYLLPVKQAVRRAEGLGEGDPVAVTLRLVGADE